MDKAEFSKKLISKGIDALADYIYERYLKKDIERLLDSGVAKMAFKALDTFVEYAKDEPKRNDILKYVAQMSPNVSQQWKNRHTKLWNDILDIEEVSRLIYEPGRQKDTNFNRKLVAQIINYLSQRGVYVEFSPSHYAMLLEGTKDHSVRNALSHTPPPEIIQKINQYLLPPSSNSLPPSHLS